MWIPALIYTNASLPSLRTKHAAYSAACCCPGGKGRQIKGTLGSVHPFLDILEDKLCRWNSWRSRSYFMHAPLLQVHWPSSHIESCSKYASSISSGFAYFIANLGWCALLPNPGGLISCLKRFHHGTSLHWRVGIQYGKTCKTYSGWKKSCIRSIRSPLFIVFHSSN